MTAVWRHHTGTHRVGRPAYDMNLPSVLSPESPEAQTVLELFWVILGIAGLVFLTVASLVIISAIRYRRRGSDDRTPPQLVGSTPLEITWTVIPLAILGVLFGLTVVSMHTIQPRAGSRQADLKVVAHQWWWEGHYKTGVVTANEFHFPVRDTLLLRFRSGDVIHDWWVPELGRKVDIFPNHATYLWTRIERPGAYLGTCDEFCGPEHAWMRIRVIAHTPEDYAAWTQRQLAPPPPPGTPDAREGKALFLSHTCVSCHTIAGLSSGSIGPNLSHVGGRETLGAGILENGPIEMARWVHDAQAVKPECRMPNLQLSLAESRRLAAFLEELK
jgi:cytochrome c oxidase subunit 2